MQRKGLFFAKIFVSLVLLFSFSPLSQAGWIANPIPSLAVTIKSNDTTSENIKSLGVQDESYFGPNETYPHRMRAITKDAPEGIYLGVGTERCLMAAVLNPQIKFLILADHDPRIVLYNQINGALLRLASHRAHYRRLRLEASFLEWQEALSLKDPQEVDSDDSEILGSPFAFNWWVSAVRTSVESDSMSEKAMMNFQDFEVLKSRGYRESIINVQIIFWMMSYSDEFMSSQKAGRFKSLKSIWQKKSSSVRSFWRLKKANTLSVFLI